MCLRCLDGQGLDSAQDRVPAEQAADVQQVGTVLEHTGAEGPFRLRARLGVGVVVARHDGADPRAPGMAHFGAGQEADDPFHRPGVPDPVVHRHDEAFLALVTGDRGQRLGQGFGPVSGRRAWGPYGDGLCNVHADAGHAQDQARIVRAGAPPLAGGGGDEGAVGPLLLRYGLQHGLHGGVDLAVHVRRGALGLQLHEEGLGGLHVGVHDGAEVRELHCLGPRGDVALSFTNFGPEVGVPAADEGDAAPLEGLADLVISGFVEPEFSALQLFDAVAPGL
mmetsp:Transcript_52197/g.93116  ORF Transcript_52197/g.93116 Transcript_52197/m.93116 type:complete len:279 (-) Transcript_52197:1749-2585(-)